MELEGGPAPAAPAHAEAMELEKEEPSVDAGAEKPEEKQMDEEQPQQPEQKKPEAEEASTETGSNAPKVPIVKGEEMRAIVRPEPMEPQTARSRSPVRTHAA
jgi:hypothetical protein